ncbi:MAG: 4Fe-4S single cluster domain-containing protein [Clostridiales bacterium]|mgnify:CR=1 FL=1|nr:4Fe-4S single cluster domain-containing protein [Clostridiales bacterium]
MKVARILYPVTVLGPGRRVGIWFSGCPHHCEHCCNPELWEQRDDQEMSLDTIFAAIAAVAERGPIEGFVLTGGDPMMQAEELSVLLPMLKTFSNDILVYTGYEHEQLLSFCNPAYKYCLKNVSVLIDGKYIDALNDGSPLRGSQNQRILFLDSSIKERYLEYLAQIGSNEIQTFPASDGFISVGIPRRGFRSDLQNKAKERGVIIRG